MEKIEFTSIKRRNSILDGFTNASQILEPLIKGKKVEDDEDKKVDENDEEEGDASESKKNSVDKIEKSNGNADEEAENKSADEEKNKPKEDEDEKDNDENENNTPSDEELTLLKLIAKYLNSDEEVTEKELEEGDGSHDEDTAKLIASLEKKGLIICEDDNITEITEEGLALLDNSDEDDEGEEDEEDEEDEEEDEKDEEDEDEGDEDEEDDDDKNTENGETEADDENESDDANENKQAPDDENNKTGDNDEEKTDDGNPVMDEASLRAHAKNTSTEDLKSFLSVSKNELQTKVAQEELASREAGGQNNAQGNGQDTPGATNTPVPGAVVEGSTDPLDFKNPVSGEENKKKFEEWIQQYLEDHDREDFEGFITELILDDPKETKILKAHYRDDFSANSRVGNKLERVDNKEFKIWLSEYLAHQPYDHLKIYAIRLLKTNPDAMNDIKNKYKSKLSLED